MQRGPQGGRAKRVRWLWYAGLVLAVGASAATMWSRARAQESVERGERRRREQEAIASAVEEKRAWLEAAVKASEAKKSELGSAMGNAKHEADRSPFAHQFAEEVARGRAAEQQLRLLRRESAAYAGSCVSGAWRCVGALGQVCGSTGQWEEPGPACRASSRNRAGASALIREDRARAGWYWLPGPHPSEAKRRT